MMPGNNKVTLTIKPIRIHTDEDNIGKTIADMVKWSVNELKKTNGNTNPLPDILTNAENKVRN